MYRWLTTKIGLFIKTFFSKLLSFLNGFSCRCQIDLKLKIIQCSSLQLFTSVCPSVHPSVCLSICLSVFPSICPWFHIPQWWLSIGESILHPFLCQMPKLAFASQLLITYFRLGMTLLCLVLIVKHEKGFGIMIRFCDLEINFHRNFIKQEISHMISKSHCWKQFFIYFPEFTWNHLSPVCHL